MVSFLGVHLSAKEAAESEVAVESEVAAESERAGLSFPLLRREKVGNGRRRPGRGPGTSSGPGNSTSTRGTTTTTMAAVGHVFFFWFGEELAVSTSSTSANVE